MSIQADSLKRMTITATTVHISAVHQIKRTGQQTLRNQSTHELGTHAPRDSCAENYNKNLCFAVLPQGLLC